MANKSRSRFPTLTPQQLRELATLVSTGIPLADAWAKATTMAHPAGSVVLRQLQKGAGLPAALNFLGLISAPQQVYLAAADNAGNLSRALQQLAGDYENREAYRRKLRSKFYVIYLLLFVGWGAGLALAAAETPESLPTILVRNTVWCLICHAIIQLTVNIVLKDGWWWLDKAWRFGMQGHQACQWALVTHWYALLGAQLAAGLDAASALRHMQGLLGQNSYRNAIRKAASSVAGGQILSQALAENGLMPNAEFRAVLVSAEAGGRESEVLDQQRRLAEDRLENFQANVMFWVPKGLYGMCGAVALLMVM